MSKLLRQENLQLTFKCSHSSQDYVLLLVIVLVRDQLCSGLKRIKSYIYSTIKQNKFEFFLNESDVLNKQGFKYNDLNDEFAKKKARRNHLQTKHLPKINFD